MPIEIAPASIEQIVRGRGGGFVTITQDVCDVAKKLKEIHPEFKLQWSDNGEYFRVVQDTPGFRPHTVTTALEADDRLVNRMRALVKDPALNAAEAEADNAAVDAAHDHTLSEAVGEASERLAHAIRTDLRQGKPGNVYMPPDMYSQSKSFRKKGK